MSKLKVHRVYLYGLGETDVYVRSEVDALLKQRGIEGAPVTHEHKVTRPVQHRDNDRDNWDWVPSPKKKPTVKYKKRRD